MSQIFCVRTETNIGLAVVYKDELETLYLLNLYPSAGDSLDTFPESLLRMIKEHDVSEIFVNALAEGEGRADELPEFASVSESVSIREMRKAVKPISGRIVRSTLLKSGKLDEHHFYDQYEKLSGRIERIDGRSEVPVDLQAYLCAVVLAKPESIDDEFDLGDTNPHNNSYSRERMAVIGGFEYRQL